MAAQGLTPGLPALADYLSKDEMSHVTAVAQKQDVPVSEEALADYIRIIQEESQLRKTIGQEDLLAIRNRLKEIKGYGG